MSFGEKVKETIVTRAAEGLGLSVGVVLIWVCSEVGSAILPAVENSLPKSILLKIALASLALNIIFLAIFWVTRKTSEFKLKYGIYWDSDKNPHCPACKIPTGAYSEYQAGWGYYCKPCGKTFPLTDAAGNDIKPDQALEEL
jgi:hypothetical protein